MSDKKKKKLIAMVSFLVPVVLGLLLGFGKLGLILCLIVGAVAAFAVPVMAGGLDLRQKEHHGTAALPFEVETLPPQVKEQVVQGQEYVALFRRLNEQIPDEVLSGKIDEIESNVNKIFTVLAQEPEKASRCHKFMTYYLPTTVKLLEGYVKLNQDTVRGENAVNARARIVETMDIVIRASEKQLESLYEADTLDLETDMDVIAQMVKRDGLADVDFDTIRSHMESNEPVSFDFEGLKASLNQDKVHA